MTGSDPEVTSLHGSHLEVAVEGLKLLFCLCLNSYKSVTRGGGCHVKGNGITGPHGPEVTRKLRHFTGTPLMWLWKAENSGFVYI